VWREVVGLGADLAALPEVAGSEVVADTAILFDWANIWVQEHPSRPSVDLDPVRCAEQWHAALRAATVTSDLVPPHGDLDRYKLILAPALPLVSDVDAANLVSYVDNGGTVLIGPCGGVVDENDHVRLNGYGAWGDLLGVRVEEFFPLAAGETVELSDRTRGHLWAELANATTAEVLLTYADGPLKGAPALTRKGRAYYLTTHLDDKALRALLETIARAAGVAPVLADPPPGIEAVQRRHTDGRTWTFIANDGPTDIEVANTHLSPGTLAILPTSR
jgi:beta-galactosidase